MVYNYLVLIHVIGVIVFLGNITIVPFWKVNAERTKDRLHILSTWQSIIRADKFFTMPGVVIILLFGLGAALHIGYNILETSWIFLSLILYVISGAVFMIKVGPIQKKVVALAQDENNFSWDEYFNLARHWNFWGSIATLTPWFAVILMVIKPQF